MSRSMNDSLLNVNTVLCTCHRPQSRVAQLVTTALMAKGSTIDFTNYLFFEDLLVLALLGGSEGTYI